MKQSTAGVTRRNFAIALTAAVPAAAQQGAPATEDLAAAARENVKRTSEQLRSITVPIATEPSTIFRP